MMMRYILLFCGIIVFSLQSLFSQNLLFDHLSVKDGLSQSNVHAIYQDEFNVMWIATAGGLNRYDGNKIESYKPIIGDSIGLFESNIGNVCGNRKGQIYLQCSSGLIIYDVQTRQFKAIERKGIDCIAYGKERLLVSHNNILKYLDPVQENLVNIHTFDEPLHTTCLFESSDDNVYLGTQFDGLLVMDKNGKCSTLIADQHIQCIYEDNRKRIWVGTAGNGMYCISNQQENISYTHDIYNPKSISSNHVRSICQDDLGFFWIATFEGLNRFNPDTKEFVNFRHSTTDKYSMGASSVWCITKDNQGSLWIGTYFGGVDIINPEFAFSQYYRPTGEMNEISGPIVSNVVEDSIGNLWICTDGAGLNYFDRQKNSFTHFKHDPVNPRSLSSNTLKALFLDEENGVLWIGTHFGGLNKLDLNTHRITRITLNENDGRINQYVRGILKYKEKLLLATHNSIQLYDPQTGLVKPFIGSRNKEINRQIWDMLIDSQDNLWFSTPIAIYRYNLQTNALKKYFPDSISTSLGQSFSHGTLFQDSKQRIWIGGSGQGLKLYVPETDSFTSFHTQNSDIIDNYVLSINETSLGYILIGTNQGVSRFDVEKNLFYNYYNNLFFPFEALNERCLFNTRKGEIGLCSLNGLLLISEQDLNFTPKESRINLTELYVNNRRIKPGDSDILQKSIFYTDTIVLNHTHSTVSFEFASSNCIKALQAQIQYKLEGFDTEWINAVSNNSTYTNLRAGTYVFRTQSCEPLTHSVITGKSLVLIVKPPIYKTGYAYLIYLLILAGLFYLIISRIELAASLKYANEEKKHIEELNQSKLRFFMNVSHEIRTPITLIISQLEILVQNNDISQSVHNKIYNIMRNANKLKHLISELLDFRKHEQGLMMLKASEQNIITYLEEVLVSFKEYAAYRQINTFFIHDEPEVKVWFDTSQLNKVFYNLLSNAFKFTPPKGSVSVIIEKESKWITISVVDTGIGIKKEEMENLFERFYQSAHIEQRIADTGTGIGLVLVKSIVELHKGNISVRNNETQGSTFTVSLPLGDAHLSDEEKREEDVNQQSIKLLAIPDADFISEIRENQQTLSLQEASILIVEDNLDLLETLAEIFNPIYKVYTAIDGKKGLELALEIQPNIILSDVVMPEISGIELCKRIKSNLEICHIPVVLLTASATEERKLEGLQIGADDYITKPFNTKILIMRCNNLVNNRVMLQQKYKLSPTTNTEQLALNQHDKILLDKAIQIVEANFSNPEFDIYTLAQEMCMGRSSLFKKIKGLTGQTPKDFIVNIRLKNGMVLLDEKPELSIADIAVLTGFSDTSYFIKLFKRNFGTTPHQYRKSDS